MLALYKLTQAAAVDFENILEFGFDRFGLQQAIDYQEGLKLKFSLISENPKMYQVVGDIKGHYRRSVYKAHSIYYRETDGFVLIVRILGRENPATSLP